ncbi:DUF2235 domain-containing protein [Microvirga massiliensis]|uniref:DUF2235 domain-containing protein n=1 Tax=Microvirga massiliensis TaxID=1033741 RepID=UPI00065FC516|nr:DUF2235 domain-containing protein [Microvirga massiliensis]
MDKRERIRKIVILADGTGNAFRNRESNIWRLYTALDLKDPDQVAVYIQGVGTSGFRPFAVLDAATGIGVPSNVRKLYRFLCWNWHPEAKVYMFGFSRGAFTIRTLIGLIASQGLVPTQIDGAPVSRAEMKRNARAAWRAYRAKQVTWRNSFPTILIARAIRDAILAIARFISGHRSYASVRAAMDAPRRTVRIRFAGLFDTVEAYGVPVEEMRWAIDRVIWPISFRNRVLSDRVDFARHALALDDERTTFHPVRFDMTAELPRAGEARIQEVWFAGVHSDVGGGYPDDGLSYLPLTWMIDEIAATAAGPDSGLRFLPGTADAFRAQASPLAPIHDSRTGLAVFYRYDPRPVRSGVESGGPPVIHHSVAEKMVFGTGNYAPLTLPESVHVLMPDGSRYPIAGFEAEAYRKSAPPAPGGPAAEAQAIEAVRQLNAPDNAFVELTRDLIWWRRAGYFALLAGGLVLIALPVTAPWLSDGIATALRGLASIVGLEDLAALAQRKLDDARDGLSSNLNDLSTMFGGLIPSYAKGWVGALVAQPVASFAIIVAVISLYRLNSNLRDRIADSAWCAWFFRKRPHLETSGQDHGRAPAEPGPFDTLARRLRKSQLAGLLHYLTSRIIVPAATLIVLVGFAAVLVGRTVVSYRSGTGGVCPETAPENLLRHPKEGVANLAEGFRTSNPCWGTGIYLVKGRLYTVWVEMAEPYLDGPKVADIMGFRDNSLRYLAGLPLRRWWTADWFQPIARIGNRGDVEWALQASDGATAPELAGDAELPWQATSSLCEGTPAPDPTLIRDIQTRKAIRRSFVSQFQAAATGELFLYLNDAITAVPFGPLVTCFYGNNGGGAKVTVELMPGPQPPAPEPYDFSQNR